MKFFWKKIYASYGKCISTDWDLNTVRKIFVSYCHLTIKEAITRVLDFTMKGVCWIDLEANRSYYDVPFASILTISWRMTSWNGNPKSFALEWVITKLDKFLLDAAPLISRAMAKLCKKNIYGHVNLVVPSRQWKVKRLSLNIWIIFTRPVITKLPINHSPSCPLNTQDIIDRA